jgi:hypothetical protein
MGMVCMVGAKPWRDMMPAISDKRPNALVRDDVVARGRSSAIQNGYRKAGTRQRVFRRSPVVTPEPIAGGVRIVVDGGHRTKDDNVTLTLQ